jgi:hypothetical protein
MRQIFSKSRLILLGKVTVFFAGTILSNYSFVDRGETLSIYLSVGAIFGIVVLTWYARSFKDLANWRCTAFLIASILIWAIAVRILYVALEMPGLLGNLNLILGGMLFGTVALPIAHALLLGASLKRTLITIACMCGTGLGNFFAFDDPIASDLTIILWQATYLIGMFGFRKRGAEVGAEVTE